jgi:hypothetical protein
MNPEINTFNNTEQFESEPRRYGRDFFDMQFKFAKEMQRITQEPFEDCLLKYTNIYKRLRLGHDMNKDNSKWQKFIDDLKAASDGPEFAAASSYIAGNETLQNKELLSSCFRYDYLPEAKTIKIHFDNNDKSENGPLAEDRIENRKQELEKIFREVKEKYPDAQYVKGSSWLYNLSSYRRLFPAEYTDHTSVNPGGLNDLGIWGQFLDKDRKVKPEMEGEFLKKIEEISEFENVLDSFSYRKLDVGCNISYFYKDLGIK